MIIHVMNHGFNYQNIIKFILGINANLIKGQNKVFMENISDEKT